jgi:hypothetical protein
MVSMSWAKLAMLFAWDNETSHKIGVKTNFEWRNCIDLERKLQVMTKKYNVNKFVCEFY